MIVYVKRAKIDKGMPLATMRLNSCHLLCFLTHGPTSTPSCLLSNLNSTSLIKVIYQLFSMLCTLFSISLHLTLQHSFTTGNSIFI